MFQRILVPLDGSTRAEQAVPLAALLARAHNGTVVLLRVVSLRPEYGPYYVPPAALSASALDADREDAAEYLNRIADSAWLNGIATEKVVPIGPAAQEILAAVDAHRADAVILCSHGRTGLTRWMMGSVADHVSRQAPVPVLMLREHGGTLVGATSDLEHQPRILVALDGSQLAEVALAPAAALATALDAPGKGAVHLLLVVTPYEAMRDNMPEALIVDGAKGYLKRTADQLRADYQGLTVTWTVAVDGDIAAGVLRVAEKGEDAEGAGTLGGCDLIAMATHGRTGFARWALGSMTERVLHATHLPMLVVRSVEPESVEVTSSAAPSGYATEPPSSSR